MPAIPRLLAFVFSLACGEGEPAHLCISPCSTSSIASYGKNSTAVAKGSFKKFAAFCRNLHFREGFVGFLLDSCLHSDGRVAGYASDRDGFIQAQLRCICKVALLYCGQEKFSGRKGSWGRPDGSEWEIGLAIRCFGVVARMPFCVGNMVKACARRYGGEVFLVDDKALC